MNEVHSFSSKTAQEVVVILAEDIWFVRFGGNRTLTRVKIREITSVAVRLEDLTKDMYTRSMKQDWYHVNDLEWIELIYRRELSDDEKLNICR